MRFENDQTVIKIQMQKRIVAVFSTVLVALTVFIPGFANFLVLNVGLPKYLFIILFLSFFILFYIYHLLKASSYIFFSDDNSKIVVRFYQLNFFNSGKFSYEIPMDDFTGYKLELRVNKMREDLILFRKYQGSIVRYPPVPISTLTMAERSKLLAALNKYVR